MSIEVPQWVVMPNHVHAIIAIRKRADAPGCIPTIRTALGVVVGGYKQAVTRYARRHNIDFGWQSRFHDHIIRGIPDGNKISEYIENNIVRWDNIVSTIETDNSLKIRQTILRIIGFAPIRNNC